MANTNLSIAIISFNEEHIIDKTLQACAEIAEEIIVVDSFSNDKTVEIAKKYNAKIYHEEWKGFVEQKNSALSKCSCDWILCLDADEVLTDDLKNEILQITSNENNFSYKINRKSFYVGKLLNYAWSPDIKLRFVNKKSNPKWVGFDAHEELKVNNEIRTLKSYLIHYSYKNITQHFEKTIKYAKLSANSYFNNGKKFKVKNLILNPIIAFIRLYFINFAFMDGVHGFIASLSSFIGTFLKYAFLWELEKDKDK